MGASEADVFDMNILHDGVNMPVSVDVRITVDTTGCGLSTGVMFKLFFCELSSLFYL